MDAKNFEITDGYVGDFGKTWETATDETLAQAISKAIRFTGKTNDEINSLLGAGKAINWCESLNFYYDHSYGMIRRKRDIKPVELVTCSCGHAVPKENVMIASLGTSCHDCYDDMSD